MKKICLKRIWLVGFVCMFIAGFSIPSACFGADSKIKLGLGIAASPEYEGSEDYEAVPVPLFSVAWASGRFIQLTGANFKANVLSGGTWQLGPAIQFRKKRDDDVNNSAVADLRKIDNAVEVGGFAGFKVNQWAASIQVVKDTSDEHDGLLTTISGSYTYVGDSLISRFELSTTYADDDYMETYFQVDSKNVGTSGLPFYNADSGIKDVGLSVVADYSLNKSWSIMGIGSYTRLVGDAEDSPVVDDEGSENQMFFGVMGIYHFN